MSGLVISYPQHGIGSVTDAEGHLVATVQWCHIDRDWTIRPNSQRYRRAEDLPACFEGRWRIGVSTWGDVHRVFGLPLPGEAGEHVTAPVIGAAA